MNDENRKDDPEMDATDFAHPAWWRGHDHTFLQMQKQLQKALGSQDSWQKMLEEVKQLKEK